MTLITHHQHLHLYPIPKDSEKLILGTIHPHHHENFLLPFFYGNKNSIWEIFADAFPHLLSRPITLEKVLSFLKTKKIAVSDTVVSCKRNDSTYLDNDFTCIQLNTELIEQIKNAKITDVFFTSGFGKNNAFKLFYVDMLHQKITSEIRKNKEILLDKSFFGRPVKLIVLMSPSGSANIAWATSKLYKENAYLYKKSTRPVYDFKVNYYRKMFE